METSHKSTLYKYRTLEKYNNNFIWRNREC